METYYSRFRNATRRASTSHSLGRSAPRDFPLGSLAEVVTCRRRKQARRACEERRVVTRNGTQLVTTLRVVTSDGQTDEEGRTVRGTVDDEEGEMRRRGARECEEALMEATEARRGYARVAAWDEGNLIQAMARLKNPTIAWRYGDG